jgi:hypothetical protein
MVGSINYITKVKEKNTSTPTLVNSNSNPIYGFVFQFFDIIFLAKNSQKLEKVFGLTLRKIPKILNCFFEK